MRHQQVFELHRRDPLASRLDDVLRTVGDLHEAAPVDVADITRAQPAVVEFLGRARVVVRRGDPRPTHLDLAHRDAVARHLDTILIDDAQLHAGHGASRLRPIVHFVLWRRSLRRQAQRADWTRLGHAPPLDQLDTQLLLERADQ